jgi:hypothetical protein
MPPTPNHYANPRIVTVGNHGQPLEILRVIGDCTEVRPVFDTSTQSHWVKSSVLIPATHMF